MKRTMLFAATATAALGLTACGGESTAGVGGSFEGLGNGEVTETPEVLLDLTGELVDPEGSVLGTATFSSTTNGTEIEVDASGLTPGDHPMLLVSEGGCTEDAIDSAPVADLPALPVTEQEVGELSTLAGEFDLDLLADEDGTSLIVLPLDDEELAEGAAWSACAAIEG
ncbi:MULTISPECIES: hypothetical protein [unclassified Modestobacter]|uniref:hypothetical protein n=1 Tax=unclassified Modestobacter TaxID=2643866 RepID=UPI0022AABCAC|nr:MULTISPECIES: hypothetical protein [unclassified Modestobacter]MCZ2824255.1 hypothetical protein [Modestobacter sp. VKM Ac-2981]MCZ2854217.1 hypothetical protein [Modestobacter sp. VKM Ac-2982]